MLNERQYLPGASDELYPDDDFAAGSYLFAPDQPLYADSVGSTTSTAGTLPLGNYITGEIETAGDSDWYMVTLVAGQTYTFQTQGQSLSDTVLRLRDASGQVLRTNDDAQGAGLSSEITFVAQTGGTYYLDVTGYDDEIGTYFLTGSVPVADAVRGSTASFERIVVGGAAVTGTLDAVGDHDWYRVDVVAGQIYEFTTTNPSTGAPLDTTLTLRNADGSLITFNDDYSGTLSRVRWTATTTGTVYLDVGAWMNSEAGQYRVQAAIGQPLRVYSTDEIATQLTQTYWGGTQRAFNVTAGGEISFNVSALTTQGMFLAREALNLWSDVTGIRFVEVTAGGQIVFDDDEPGAFAQSSRTGGVITSSTVNISTQWLTTSGTTIGSYSFQTYLHEIGHALGLGHAGPYNTSADYDTDASYLNDSWATTVMSYFSQSENTYFQDLSFSRQNIVTPIVADIVAINRLYGTPTTTRTGDTVYGFNNTSGRAAYQATTGLVPLTQTIVDNGGVDRLDYSGFAQNQRIDLRQEAFSNIGGGTGNVTIARGTVIENATGGSGNDELFGNAAENRLDGGAGTDRMHGGAGNDHYTADSQSDLIFENPAEGYDTITAGSSFYLYQHVEGLILREGIGNAFGVGNALNNYLQGNEGENLLIGGAGDDQLNGNAARDALFGEDGIDALNGGAGVDYLVAGAGADRLDGGDDADEMYGEDGNDELLGGDSFHTDIMVGGAGNDTIYGNSGQGDYDLMYGNEGDDVFYVDTPADLVFEQAGEGTDTVYAGIVGAGFYLYANIENLVLTGQTPFGVGNALANTITGNAVGNYLLGGDGNDVLNGMGGNDVLFGEGGADTFVFTRGTGGDIIGDYQVGVDRIDLRALGILSYQQLQGAMVQNGNDLAIDIGAGDFIILHNVQMAQLSANDFWL